ncbi:sodium channel protein Nach-like [Ostrinia furnacalis]|uniref:sodium channel protein Nach-like n=1 Tax=Ostrinia furnacalis TaxID=93504 RepID=UPI00103E92B3|nr:sodium channel protein Nach-like [Ostrinia furnacalis]
MDSNSEIFYRMHAVREVWWQKYRRQQYKRKRLSLEMIVRKSAREAGREYISHCSVAGVKQIRDPDIGIIERLIWIALFVVMVASLIKTLMDTKQQTILNPLIVTMESSTHPISDIDFPAIALCNVNRISKKSLEALATNIFTQLLESEKQPPNEHFPLPPPPWIREKGNVTTLRYVHNYVYQLGYLLDYWWDENTKIDPHIDELLSPENNTRMLIDIMKELAPSCEDMLVTCIWAARRINCSDIFQVRRTSRGHCCAFNYVLDYDSAKRPSGTIAEVKRQNVPGYLQGLNILLDPKIEDYAYTVSPSLGFKIFLFDPTHFADPNAGGRVTRRIIEPGQWTYLQLQSVKQFTTREVKKYPVKTRKCLYHDEDTETFGSLYSYSACIVSCKIKTINTLCKCTPFFLPTNRDDSVCTLNELRCLNKYKEKLLYLYPTDALITDGLETELEDSLWCPQCQPDCEFTQHFSKAFNRPLTLAFSEFEDFKEKEHLFELL